MNSHQQMAMDDIGIIGLLAVFLWYRVIEYFGWGVLIGAVLATAYVGLRIYHMTAWSDERLTDDQTEQ